MLFRNLHGFVGYIQKRAWHCGIPSYVLSIQLSLTKNTEAFLLEIIKESPYATILKNSNALQKINLLRL